MSFSALSSLVYLLYLSSLSVLSSSSSSNSTNLNATNAPSVMPKPTETQKVPDLPARKGAQIQDMKLFVDGERFYVKGIDYSPVPIGASPIFNKPYGDYFSDGYEEIWERDFPKIRQLGANTVRIYTWRVDLNHTSFLDWALKHEVKVLATFYLGTGDVTPLTTENRRSYVIKKFANEVRKYAHHPALLGWTFGNEINSLVNGFLPQLNVDAGCGWTKDCWNSSTAACAGPKKCIYGAVFRLLNRAATAGKNALNSVNAAPKLMTTAFADLDDILTFISEYDGEMSSIDSWGFNLYRGKDFGQGENDVLGNWKVTSSKPLLVTEYGVDAFRDYCGVCTEDECLTPCQNTVDSELDGYGEDEQAQAEWSGELTKILINHWENGTLGGFIMSWVDEYWKNAVAVQGCPVLYGQPGFSASTCQWKAHVDCPHSDAASNSLCGYWLSTTFDNYVNEGWYGLHRVEKGSGGAVDTIHPRDVFFVVQKLYGGSFYDATLNPLYRQPWFIASITLFLLAVVPLALFEFRLVMSQKQQHSSDEVLDKEEYTRLMLDDESPLRRPRSNSRME